MSNQKVWKTKDGKEIRLADMAFEHLKNVERMLEVKALRRIDTLQNQVLNWGCPQGEMAEMAFDQGVEEILEDQMMGNFERYADPIYFDVIQEIEKRIEERKATLDKYCQ